jgi:hypothetical protein
MGEEMIILSIRPCVTSSVLLHAVKSYDMGSSRFTSHPKEGVLRIFIALKNPSPWPGSNRLPLGPVASTLTTTPPRRLSIHDISIISAVLDKGTNSPCDVQ